MIDSVELKKFQNRIALNAHRASRAQVRDFKNSGGFLFRDCVSDICGFVMNVTDTKHVCEMLKAEPEIEDCFQVTPHTICE